MSIKEIDKNFDIVSENEDGLKYYNIPCEPFDIYGVIYEEAISRFVRMPSSVANEISSSVSALNTNTAGGRIKFSTDSERVSISVKYSSLTSVSHMSVLGSSGFILLEERENKTVFVYSYMPNYYCNDKEDATENGYTVTKQVNDGKLRNYILYFPNYNDVVELKIGLDENAVVGHGKKYADKNPVLYYGSSITQGGCASRADNTYTALISKWTNVDFINYGFSGSAVGEIKMAEYLASIDCSVFVYDYDFNAPTPEFLEQTHLPFYRAYREKRPNTPILIISNPDTDENFMDAKERFNVIKKTYDTLIKEGDKNVYLINGKQLYGRDCRENCTVDGTHPNDLGFYKMAKRIMRTIAKLL